MTKKIVRVTVDLVVDETTNVKQLINEIDYDFNTPDGDVIYETEIIDFEEIDY